MNTRRGGIVCFVGIGLILSAIWFADGLALYVLIGVGVGLGYAGALPGIRREVAAYGRGYAFETAALMVGVPLTLLAVAFLSGNRTIIMLCFVVLGAATIAVGIRRDHRRR